MFYNNYRQREDPNNRKRTRIAASIKIGIRNAIDNDINPGALRYPLLNGVPVPVSQYCFKLFI